MTVEEYLKGSPAVDLSYIAGRMWPNNKNAKVYLSMKLNNKAGRSFTKADAKKAMEVLKELSSEISNLTVE